MLPAGADAAEAFYRVVDAAYERRSVASPRTCTRPASTPLMPKSIATALSTGSCTTPTSCHRRASVRLEEALAGAGVVALTPNEPP